MILTFFKSFQGPLVGEETPIQVILWPVLGICIKAPASVLLKFDMISDAADCQSNYLSMRNPLNMLQSQSIYRLYALLKGYLIQSVRNPSHSHSLFSLHHEEEKRTQSDRNSQKDTEYEYE